MDIDKQKGLFLNILKEYADKEGRAIISNDILIENGLDGRTFWEIICPSLKKEGVVISFDDPNIFFYNISNNLDYIKLFKEKELLLEDRMKYSRTAHRNDVFEVRGSSNIALESIDGKIEKIDSKTEDLKVRLKKNFSHTFLINNSKLENKIDEQKNFNKEIYIFSGYEKNPTGKLKIGEVEIEFNKIPAIIVHFFYELSKMGTEYKTYKDYNDFIIKKRPLYDIQDKIKKSDHFNKKINNINKKVKNNTNNMVKEIIEKGITNKKRDPNIFRWNKEIK